MNRILRIAAVALVALALSNAAVAQMGGRGPGPGGNGNGTMAGPGPSGAHPFVAPDGKALLVKRTTTSSGATTTTTVQLVAVSTAGTVAWTHTPANDVRDLSFPSGLVAFVSAAQGQAATSQVVALNLASGTQAWAATFDGMVGDLEVTSSGLLAVVSKSTAATGTDTQGTVTRTLVSINLSGNVAWSLALD